MRAGKRRRRHASRTSSNYAAKVLNNQPIAEHALQRHQQSRPSSAVPAAMAMTCRAKLASLQTDLAVTKADTSLTADERIARYGKILTPPVTEVRQGVDKLKALRPPQTDQPFFRRWIASLEVERDKLAQYTADLTSGDNASLVDAYRVQRELGSAAATYRGLSQGYGFKVCGAS